MGKFQKFLDSHPLAPVLAGVSLPLLIALYFAYYYQTPAGKARQHEIYVEGCAAGRIEPNKCIREGIVMRWWVQQ